jgi:hypothetical protein
LFHHINPSTTPSSTFTILILIFTIDKMRSVVVAVPALAALMGIPIAVGEMAMALTPVATYPPVRPSPIPYVPGVNRPAAAAATAQAGQGQKQAGGLVLSQVPARPTPTTISPEKCSEVASKITPLLTPTPTYPAALKAMADKIGGIERDAKDLNRFTQARYQAFILPMWARIQDLWAACGDTAATFSAITSEPCYRWALELSKASNASFGSPINKSNNADKTNSTNTSNDNKDSTKNKIVSEQSQTRVWRPRLIMVNRATRKLPLNPRAEPAPCRAHWRQGLWVLWLCLERQCLYNGGSFCGRENGGWAFCFLVHSLRHWFGCGIGLFVCWRSIKDDRCSAWHGRDGQA